MNSTSAMRWVSIVRITLTYDPSQSGSGSFATYIRYVLIPDETTCGSGAPVSQGTSHSQANAVSLPFSIFPALRRARLLNRKYSCFVPTLALSCLPYSSSTFCMAATAHTFTVASVPPPASHSPLGDQARACASFCPLSASHTSTRLGRTLTIARRSPSGDQASVPPLIS